MAADLMKMGKLARATTKVARTLSKANPVKLTRGLKKETEVNKQLHADVLATLKRMKEKDKGLAKAIDEAYGFAVLPAVGKATLALGGTYGKGEVFKQKRLAGYCALGQFTLGVQVGGQTFSELVLIQNKAAFDHFKHAGLGFAANASAVIVKAGAAATNNYKDGLQIFVAPEGGMMLEAAIGLQKLGFRPAALTRGKKADEEPEVPRWLEEGPFDEAAEAEAGRREARGEEAEEEAPEEAEARGEEEEEAEEAEARGEELEVEEGEGAEQEPPLIPLSVWRRALREAERGPARRAEARARPAARTTAKRAAGEGRPTGAKRRRAPAAAARRARAPSRGAAAGKTSAEKRRAPASPRKTRQRARTKRP